MWTNNTANKKKQKEAEKRTQATLNMKASIRQMNNCVNQLTQAEDLCRSFIVENERAGRHALALQNVRTFRSIAAMKNKVANLATRLEMLMEMDKIGNVMSDFIEKCSNVGGVLEGLVNPGKLFSSMTTFDNTMNTIDELLYRSESMLEPMARDDIYSTPAKPEDLKALAEIMAEQNQRDITAQYSSDVDEITRELDELSRSRARH